MILAETVTAFPEMQGLLQIGAAGVAVFFLLSGGGKKPAADGSPAESRSWREYLSKFVPGSTAADGESTSDEPPTVGEAYVLLERLEKLAANRVAAYGDGFVEARRPLPGLIEPPKPTKPEGPPVVTA